MQDVYSLEHTAKPATLLTQRAKVVEFVGPPGAGKTTCSRHFTAALENHGLRVLVLQDIKDYVKALPYADKVKLLFKTLFSRGYAIMLFSFTLASRGIYSYDSLYRYTRLNIFHTALKQILQHTNVDIVLLEQWVVQELWSATIFKSVAYESLPARFRNLYFYTDITIYFDIDLATAAERIAARQTRRSRFDIMDASTRLAQMHKYNNYLFQLFQNSKCRQKLTLSTAQSPEANAEIFIDFLNRSVIKQH